MDQEFREIFAEQEEALEKIMTGAATVAGTLGLNRKNFREWADEVWLRANTGRKFISLRRGVVSRAPRR